MKATCWMGTRNVQVNEVPEPGWAGAKMQGRSMLKNTTRGILGLILTAAATWLANYIVDRIFGPDQEQA